MKNIVWYFTIVVIVLSANFTLADVATIGDVTPANPMTWNYLTHAYIGRTNDGTLSITDGGKVYSGHNTIGDGAGSKGQVTVDGIGSQLNNLIAFYVGKFGSGSLNITNGGSVNGGNSSFLGYFFNSMGTITVDGTGSQLTSGSGLTIGAYGNGTLNIINNGTINVSGDTWVSRYSSSSGTINFDNGTVTTGGLLCDLDDLTGTGTINTRGLVSDIDLIFDASHGLEQTFTLNNRPGQNITLNLDARTASSMGAGYSGSGSMSILDGEVIESSSGYVGYKTGSTGVVTVNGDGSEWINNSSLTVGNYGNGTLNISDGSQVTVANQTSVAVRPNSSGTINFDNGILTTGGLLCGLDNLTGTGTINTHGLVSDVDMTFNASNGLNQTFTISDNPNQNITLNLDIDGSAPIGVGYNAAGIMNISEGQVVHSTTGYIGYKTHSEGQVTVDGVGSKWVNSLSEFTVGYYGDGTLNITNGGTVDNSKGYGYSYVGYIPDSTGRVTVDGIGSVWSNQGLYIGFQGDGTLNISNGGIVSGYESIVGGSSDSNGTVTVDGIGSMWKNNTLLRVGYSGSGTLNIIDGGFVIASALNIGNDGFINMSSGGMLAIFGQAESSIEDFLSIVLGTDAIRFWDDSISDWSLISNATINHDFYLDYITEADLSGFTVLTVVPEPATLSLFLLGGLMLLKNPRKHEFIDL